MNKMIKITALIALAAVSLFSQENLKIGAHLGLVMNDCQDCISGVSKSNIDMGMGYGGGVIASIPIIPSLTIVPELNFFYKELYHFKLGPFESYVNEFAISVPIAVQYNMATIASFPIWLSAGAQFDIPFSSEAYQKNPMAGIDGKVSLKDRSVVDIGFIFGLGYNINSSLVLDLKYVFGLTSVTSVDGDESSVTQMAFGVSYYFL